MPSSSWERLQEGPEEGPLTDDLDGDILLSENRSRHSGIGRSFRNILTVTTKYRFCVPFLIATTIIFLLVPTIVLLTVQQGGGDTSTSRVNYVPFRGQNIESTTPFIEPIDFNDTTEISVRSISPVEFLPIFDFVYDYWSLYESFVSTNSTNKTKTVEITVYYETLNVPSRHFLTYQFFPEILKQGMLNVKIFPKLVPYGHANLTKDPGSGKEKLFCENGQKECQANAVQTCAIRHTQWNNTDSVQNLMHFVNCMTRSGDVVNTTVDDIGIRCAGRAGVNWNIIFNCAKNSEGILVAKIFKQKTESVLNKYKTQTPMFLPVVTVNGYGILSDEDKNNFSNFISKRLEN